MELRVLRYFLTVAKEQSFTKAAEQLHITQPTLSRQLAALEEELGSSLFHRGGHSITLTDEGLGYPISIEGAAKYWRKDLIIQKPLHPEIVAHTVIAWKRNIPHSKVVNKFIEEIQRYDAKEFSKE